MDNNLETHQPPIMASLDRIPPEISNQIFQHFLPDYNNLEDTGPVFYSPEPRQDPDQRSWYALNQHVFFNLALTCRHLRSVAEMYLYEEFAPGLGDSWKVKPRLFSWTGRFATYARTILERPDLAARVRRLYLHHKVLDAMTVDELLKIVPLVVLELADRAPSGDWEPPLLVETRHNPDLKWTLKDRVELRLELAKMLTFLMPNLEHLSILVSDKRQWNPFVIRETPTQPLRGLNVSQFQKLRRFDLALTEDTKSDVTAVDESLEPALKMFQHLEVLQLDRVCSIGLSYRGDTVRHSLKTLRLTRTKLYANEVEQVLACCPNVERFIYEAGPPMFHGDLPWPPGGDHFHPADFTQAVAAKNPPNLKEIRLDLRRGGGYYRRTADEVPVTGFRDISSLKTLFIDLDAWRKIAKRMSPPDRLPEMLPPDLETLELAETIWHSGETFEDIKTQLNRLAAFIGQGLFPQLKRIRFDAIDKASLGDLKARLAKHGVSLEAATFPFTGSLGRCRRVPHEYDEWGGFHAPMPLPGDLSDDDL